VMTNSQSAASHRPSTIVFLKLGGSLITDKTRVEHARLRTLRRLAREVAAAREARPDLKLVLGHGSGSFGHVAAKKHGTREGVKDQSGWYGFAEVAAAAARLNQIVTDVFVAAGVPVVSLPPSASARCENGRLVYLDTFALKAALRHDLVPLVQGDVALDSQRGATIVSTEDVFVFLANDVEPGYILLAGEVEGVFETASMRGRIIDVITPASVEQYAPALGGSRGADVTGGMAGKVRQMLDLVQRRPSIKARIFSGSRTGNVQRLLLNPHLPVGTVISHDG
jgi:isopentenyl phosphate kinase